MAIALRPHEPIDDQLKRLARKALRSAADALLEDQGAREVHRARQSIKKARAVMRLLKAAAANIPKKDRKRLREAGRSLSPLRDADAIIETFDRLRTRVAARLPEHTYAIMRRQLVQAKALGERRARADGAIVRTAKTLAKLRRSSKRWRIPSIDVAEWPALVRVSYRAARNAMTRARTREADDLHRWRRRAKTLMYHLGLTKPLAPGIGRQTRQTKQIEAWLGEDHNLVVLRTTLSADATLAHMQADVRELAALAARRQEELQRKALALGRRVFAAKPKQFVRRLERELTAGRRRRKHRRAPRMAA